jgi:hypothetical protein
MNSVKWYTREHPLKNDTFALLDMPLVWKDGKEQHPIFDGRMTTCTPDYLAGCREATEDEIKPIKEKLIQL